jgi:hypothetical protein
MLSCSCHDGCSWWYTYKEDFIKLETNKRKRCCSCKVLIDKGSEVIAIERWRNPNTDIEERIHGDEVPLAFNYLCEKCGEIFLNLQAYGYCGIDPSENMQELLEEHWEYTGFTPE